MNKKPEKQKPQNDEFARFEILTKNLMSVSNVEVRAIMTEEKRQKNSKKNKQKQS